MDEQAHKTWWHLHLRVARGETLSVEEQALYEAGLQEMDAEETLNGSVEALREARRKVVELKQEFARLRAEYEALEAKIAAREANLSEPTRQLLGIGG